MHAKRTCKVCYGVGAHRTFTLNPEGAHVPSETVCHCAWSRFLQKNKDLIYNADSGAWYWPPSRA